MKILILEDEPCKAEKIKSFILKSGFVESENIDEINIFLDFAMLVGEKKYDLIIADLMVPMYKDSQTTDDVGSQIVDVVRRETGKNLTTPVLALTAYENKAEDHFKELNARNIIVVTYSKDNHDWEASLSEKLNECRPPKTYDFVVICALQKEANAYEKTDYQLNESFVQDAMQCREIKLNHTTALIVVAPKMGLVTAAIITTKIIEKYKPKFVCMSGICAGIDGNAKIYDTIVFDNCHQHDYGKWTNSGFKTEMHTIQICPELKASIDSMISTEKTKNKIKENIVLNGNEFPEDMKAFDFEIKMSTSTSSGNAVIENQEAIQSITSAQRKLTAFDMETYAVYEAARVSEKDVRFFSVKSVVDNGVVKSDEFHRVASILSARLLCEIINEISSKL